MTINTVSTRLLFTTLLCALPFTAAVAQTPPTNPPSAAASNPASQPAPVAPAYVAGYGPGYSQGAPGTYPLPPSYGNFNLPSYQPSYPPAYRPDPGSAYARPRYHGPGYSRTGSHPSRQMPELIQDITDQGYRLTIRLSPNQKPEDIKIEPRGRGLLISSVRESYSSSEQENQNGRGYSRSFSFSSGRFQRRLGVPPDANLGAMTRSDQDNSVIIILPRP